MALLTFSLTYVLPASFRMPKPNKRNAKGAKKGNKSPARAVPVSEMRKRNRERRDYLAVVAERGVDDVYDVSSAGPKVLSYLKRC